MKFDKQMDAIDRLHNLIKRKATGTPEQLSEKFEVSVGTIKNWINILKDRNLPVKYCRDKQTYYYEYEVELRIFWVKAVEDSKNIRGGENNYNFFSPSQNFCLDPYDICNRLTNNGEQSDAGGFDFWKFGS